MCCLLPCFFMLIKNGFQHLAYNSLFGEIVAHAGGLQYQLFLTSRRKCSSVISMYKMLFRESLFSFWIVNCSFWSLMKLLHLCFLSSIFSSLRPGEQSVRDAFVTFEFADLHWKINLDSARQLKTNSPGSVWILLPGGFAVLPSCKKWEKEF